MKTGLALGFWGPYAECRHTLINISPPTNCSTLKALPNVRELGALQDCRQRSAIGRERLRVQGPLLKEGGKHFKTFFASPNGAQIHNECFTLWWSILKEFHVHTVLVFEDGQYATVSDE